MAFSLFSSLPAELRNQIWHDALPDKVGQALFFYRKGCWCPRRLTEADEDYDPENDELNLNYEFRHDLLDYVQFEVPLFFVNREARGIASAWVREQGLKIHFHKDRESLLFVRPFDPMHDTLYVPLDKWDEFLCEPFNRQFEPDLLDRNVNCPVPAFTRIAVPETLLQDEDGPLAEFFYWYSSLKTLFIVVNVQPELQPEDNDIRVQQRWELESTQGAMFFWNSIGRGAFEPGSSECNGDRALHELLDEASNGLGERLTEKEKHSFEVWPVFAVRK